MAGQPQRKLIQQDFLEPWGHLCTFLQASQLKDSSEMQVPTAWASGHSVCVCVCGECAGGKGAESRRMLVEEEEKGERRSGTGGATEEPGSAQVMLE